MDFDRTEHLRKIAIKGGKKRIEMYGNPGTVKGRRAGGLKSISTHNKLSQSPFVSRSITEPAYSDELAEFIGILLGDGGITNRQVTVTLHKTDDKDYADFVSRLVNKLFNIEISVKERRNQNVSLIVISRTRIVKFLCSMGMKIGSKVGNQVDVPEWITKELEYKRACLRGLFDTDGCFYVDKHVIKGKLYKNPGMNFTNRSLPLLK